MCRFGTVYIMLDRLLEVRKALEKTVTDAAWDEMFKR